VTSSSDFVMARNALVLLNSYPPHYVYGSTLYVSRVSCVTLNHGPFRDPFAAHLSALARSQFDSLDVKPLGQLRPAMRIIRAALRDANGLISCFEVPAFGILTTLRSRQSAGPRQHALPNCRPLETRRSALAYTDLDRKVSESPPLPEPTSASRSLAGTARRVGLRADKRSTSWRTWPDDPSQVPHVSPSRTLRTIRRALAHALTGAASTLMSAKGAASTCRRPPPPQFVQAAVSRRQYSNPCPSGASPTFEVNHKHRQDQPPMTLNVATDNWLSVYPAGSRTTRRASARQFSPARSSSRSASTRRVSPPPLSDCELPMLRFKDSRPCTSTPPRPTSTPTRMVRARGRPAR